MRLVLHNRSAKENQELVTAGNQSGGIEVEDRRWHFSQPLNNDVKLWHGKLTRCNIVSCVFTRHLALKKIKINIEWDLKTGNGAVYFMFFLLNFIACYKYLFILNLMPDVLQNFGQLKNKENISWE